MTASQLHHWSYPTRIVFGEGAVAGLPELGRDLGMRNALLVTDEGLRDTGLVQTVLRLARSDGLAVEIFSEVKGNPTASNVEAVVAEAYCG